MSKLGRIFGVVSLCMLICVLVLIVVTAGGASPAVAFRFWQS